jgi:orotidine-5'-phosphate decarboxylase
VRAGWRGTDDRTSGPIIVNSSRAVLYASRGNEFAGAARQAARLTRDLLAAARTAS